jgi:hypothetical protein
MLARNHLPSLSGGPASDQLEVKLAANQRGGALQRLNRDVALVGIDDAVDLQLLKKDFHSLLPSL